ncbi:hypothetical protein DB30_05099 [Enhygromyxa salina]|uniref:Uncharacterized protein n=1 Tax=Enhygromyxa salina TaxID=215803 RepID=A0A0C1ZXL5_9BACT|nr:hypothetical protein [Enhygromyxa salina]KIG15908.1 hypothetical protein DB30_05099 [Enhygromyxa salina]
MLVTLISGRIVPAFTASGFEQSGTKLEVVTHPRVGIFAVVAVDPRIAGLCRSLGDRPLSVGL